MPHHSLTAAQKQWGNSLRTKLTAKARTGGTTLVDAFIIADDPNSYFKILVDDGKPYVIISASLRKHPQAKEAMTMIEEWLRDWKKHPESLEWRLP